MMYDHESVPEDGRLGAAVLAALGEIDRLYAAGTPATGAPTDGSATPLLATAGQTAQMSGGFSIARICGAVSIVRIGAGASVCHVRQTGNEVHAAEVAARD